MYSLMCGPPLKYLHPTRGHMLAGCGSLYELLPPNVKEGFSDKGLEEIKIYEYNKKPLGVRLILYLVNKVVIVGSPLRPMT